MESVSSLRTGETSTSGRSGTWPSESKSPRTRSGFTPNLSRCVMPASAAMTKSPGSGLKRAGAKSAAPVI